MKVFLLENYPFEYGDCPLSLIAANDANDAHKIYMSTSNWLTVGEKYSVEEFKEIRNVSYNGDACILVDKNEMIV
jgi:hypothetical protein